MELTKKFFACSLAAVETLYDKKEEGFDDEPIA